LFADDFPEIHRNIVAASRRKDADIHDGGHGKSLDHVECIESSVAEH